MKANNSDSCVKKGALHFPTTSPCSSADRLYLSSVHVFYSHHDIPFVSSSALSSGKACGPVSLCRSGGVPSSSMAVDTPGSLSILDAMALQCSQASAHSLIHVCSFVDSLALLWRCANIKTLATLPHCLCRLWLRVSRFRRRSSLFIFSATVFHFARKHTCVFSEPFCSGPGFLYFLLSVLQCSFFVQHLFHAVNV